MRYNGNMIDETLIDAVSAEDLARGF
ncbi:MAG: hypothetical protein UT55_C0096G0007, partial [Candidatus Peregrinibacteria bacterium GW2011_GWE2_39_6]